MQTIYQQAKKYADTNIEFFDSDGNPCVQPAFEAGANYVLDEIEKCVKSLSHSRLKIDTIKQIIEQLKK